MIGDAERQVKNWEKLPTWPKKNENRDSTHCGVSVPLKYFILKVDARKNMLFNPAESIDFNGNTGPFIQYTYARIRSIMRRLPQKTSASPNRLRMIYPINDKETDLIQKMNDSGAAVEQAGKDYSP